MTLFELLDELEQVDLETYRKWFNDYDVLGLDQWQLDSLQGCIQRACERRGWPVVLSFDCDPDHPQTWVAEICDGKGALLGMAVGHESLSEALLAAYVAAVKEEKQVQCIHEQSAH